LDALPTDSVGKLLPEKGLMLRGDGTQDASERAARMTHFSYKAAAADGRIDNGVIEALDPPHARTILLDRGLAPVSISMRRTPTATLHKPSVSELAVAFRSVSILLDAGVPLDRALMMTLPISASRVRPALAKAQVNLAEGDQLAEALAKSPGVVPPLILAMIRSGERSSRLAQSVAQAAALLERQAEQLKRIQQALAYPIVLLIGGVVAVAVIAGVVVPRFLRLFEDLGVPTPRSLALIAWVVDWAAKAALPGLVAVIGAAVFLRYWLKSSDNRYRFHELLLQAPIIGALRRALAGVHVLRSLNGGLDSGLPITAALEVSGKACGDAAVEARLSRVREQVAEGQSIAASLSASGALPQVAVQFIAMGESSGRLAEMCGRAADVLDRETDRRISTGIRMLEPLLVVMCGGLITLIAATLLRAVYSLRPA
jgi:general secretion pathway protein F